jgi:hypothetical protein
MKMSETAFVSPATKFVASDEKTTYRPVDETGLPAAGPSMELAPLP